MYKKVPLPKSFMLVSMVGLLIVLFEAFREGSKLDQAWAWALGILFGLMFIASLISLMPNPKSAKPSSMASFKTRSARKLQIERKPNKRTKPKKPAKMPKKKVKKPKKKPVKKVKRPKKKAKKGIKRR